MEEKKHLRQQLRTQRKSLSAAFKARCASLVLNHIQQQSFFQQAQHIAFYSAMLGELEVEPVLELALAQKKFCYLPFMLPDNKRQLLFMRYREGDDLQPNQLGVLEPRLLEEKITEPTQLDLVLLPLVAFNEHGHRLGQGLGCYDRAFAFKKNALNKKPLLVGIAYDFQQQQLIPVNEWDIKLDAVVTESRVIYFSGNVKE